MSLQRMFKTTLAGMTLATSLTLAGMLGGCSSSTSPNGTGTVTMQSELTSKTVSRTAEKGGAQISGTTVVDSVQITSVRVFLKDLKMHRSDEDTLKDDLGGTVKTGAFVAVFDSAGTHIIGTNTIPVGTYDRIKFEIHKPDPTKDGVDFTDPAFADFVKGDKYTVIITGRSYTAGLATAFTLRSKVTENWQVRFPQNLTLGDGAAATVALQFDPKIAFAISNVGVLNPLDGGNQSAFDNQIKAAIKASRKS